MNAKNADEFKAQVKAWLKSRGIDYLWLAEQCGVSENTVRNWMAKAPIPALKQKLLRKLIAQLPGQYAHNPDGVQLEVTPTVSLSIRMSSDVYDRLVIMAQKQGMDVGMMLRDVLADLAEKAEIPEGSALHLRSRKVVLPVSRDDEPII